MGILYNDNWSVASVFDQAGNVVQMNTLIGGGETGYTMEPITQEVTSGDYQSGERNTLMLATAELDGAEQVAEWVASGTPVAAVALSTGQHGRNYLWQGYRKLSEKLNSPKAARSEGDGFLKVVLLSDTVEPKRVTNLANVIDITEDGGRTVGEIILPVEGVTVTLSHQTGGPSTEHTIQAIDFDGNELEIIENQQGLFGRTNIKLTTPADTWKVAFDTHPPAGQGISFLEVALMVNGSTSYTDG